MTVITAAFTKAAELRAKALGMPDHPVVVIDHPMYSKTSDEIADQARNSVQKIVDGLTSANGGIRNG